MGNWNDPIFTEIDGIPFEQYCIEHGIPLAPNNDRDAQGRSDVILPCLRAQSVQLIELPGGGSVSVPKAAAAFPMWRGTLPEDTFGGKHLLDYCGKPVFAELYILRMLQADGWDGVWVNSFRHEYLTNYHPRERATLPIDRQSLLTQIAGTGAFPSGCWDIFAWRDDAVLFAECKRSKKDAIRKTQRCWIEKALDVGVPLDAFLVVEWTLLQ